MTRKEVNKSLAKPLTLAAGILGLIQGIVWTTFSILCICCYTGSIQVESTTIYNETDYYIYIYNRFLQKSGKDIPNVLINPREFFIFMWFYVVFSIIWTLLSGTLIWAMIHNRWQFTKYLFGGWSLITLLTSLVDIILTSLIARDYDWLDGAATAMYVTYGIVMSVAARGYILWITNVIFASIILKFAITAALSDRQDTAMPIIHGYETEEMDPPWFSGTWETPEPPTPQTNGGYQNHGFERSQSFFPATIPTNKENNSYDVFSNPRPSAPRSFAESIAERVATIGKNKGRRSPVRNVPPPVISGPTIPDPDYTPPGSPTGLKSVLRTRSNYQ